MFIPRSLPPAEPQWQWLHLLPMAAAAPGGPCPGPAALSGGLVSAPSLSPFRTGTAPHCSLAQVPHPHLYPVHTLVMSSHHTPLNYPLPLLVCSL